MTRAMIVDDNEENVYYLQSLRATASLWKPRAKAPKRWPRRGRFHPTSLFLTC